MSRAFFYKTNDRQTFGPFSTQELKLEALQGRLNPNDTVWIDGANEIYKGKLIKGLFDSADSPQAPAVEPPAVNISPTQDTTSKAPVINVDPTPQAETTSTPPALPTQSKEWFYAKEDQQLGPYSKQELVSLLGKDIDGQTLLVWKEGMENWVEAGTVLPLVNQTNADVSNQIVSRRSKQEPARSQRIIIYSILGLVVVVAGVIGIIATTTDLIFAPTKLSTQSSTPATTKTENPIEALKVIANEIDSTKPIGWRHDWSNGPNVERFELYVVPNSTSYDVQETNSLVSPFRGIVTYETSTREFIDKEEDYFTSWEDAKKASLYKTKGPWKETLTFAWQEKQWVFKHAAESNRKPDWPITPKTYAINQFPYNLATKKLIPK